MQEGDVTTPTGRQPPPPASSSAAAVKRLMKYSSIEHRALPASPTFRRSRFSIASKLDALSTGSGEPTESPTRRLSTTLGTSVGGITSPDELPRRSSEYFAPPPMQLPVVLQEDLEYGDGDLKDFYESELLLYRNFGVERGTNAAEDDEEHARYHASSWSEGMQQSGATVVAAASTTGGASGGRPRAPSHPVSPGTTVTASAAAAVQALSQSTERFSFESERRLGLRRRGSVTVGDPLECSVDPPPAPPSDGSGSRARSRSPHRMAQSPSRAMQRSKSPHQHTTSNLEDSSNMFEFIRPPSALNPHSSASEASGSPNASASPLVGASGGGGGSRSNSRSRPHPLRRKSLRGSWSEHPGGAPRTLTSTTRKSAATAVTMVDMEQEFNRFAASNAHRGEDWDGGCNCDEATIVRHVGKIDPQHVDSCSMFESCAWCNRSQASFLCLACGATLCPSHVKAHACDDQHDRCVLFINMLDITTSYDRIYWCERCECFTFKYTDPYCELADALVRTRKTYLKQPATDVFMRHYQVADHTPTSDDYSQKLAADTTSQASLRLIASSASMQGWRAMQEDSEVSFYLTAAAFASAAEGNPALTEAIDTYFGQMTGFCVFDGHGGDSVAKLASHTVATHVRKSIHEELMTMAGEAEEQLPDDHPNLFADEAQRRKFFSCALKRAFVRLDAEMESSDDGQQGFYGSVGATALLVLITKADIVCASCGDSRACVYDVHRARAMPLSADHTLDDDREVKRVLEAGYNVSDGRIEGQLAVPRALGDFDFKQCGGKPPEEQAVSCEPDVHLIARSALKLQEGEEPVAWSKLPPIRNASPARRNATPPEEWFVVLGCDGVWEVFSTENCCSYLNDHFVQLRREKQLDAYNAAGGVAPTGAPGAGGPSPLRSQDGGAMQGAVPVGRRSRHNSLRGNQHHPANNIVLHANVLNDIVGLSICATLKRALSLCNEEGGPGTDNMSLVVARLCVSA